MTIPIKGTFAFDWAAQPDYPSWGSAQFKQNLNARDEELKSALNAVADMLNSTAVGVGGADNIGATAPTGLTGLTVQAILSALKTAIDTQETAIDAQAAVIDTHKADITLAHGINNYAKTAQQAWIAPTLINGWTNLGGSYPTAAYMKDAMGFVHLKGMVKGGANQTIIFVLPVGYRPLDDIPFATVATDAWGELSLNFVGNVVPMMGNPSGFVSLNQIIFKAEQ